MDEIKKDESLKMPGLDVDKYVNKYSSVPAVKANWRTINCYFYHILIVIEPLIDKYWIFHSSWSARFRSFESFESNF